VGVAVYTILGGMLSVLVTDYMQFIVMSAGLIVVTILILMNVGWENLVTTVETHYGAGGFNPFINPTMGWQYVVFNLMLNTAAVLTWQTIIARVLSAKDTMTGRKVYTRTSFFFIAASSFLVSGESRPWQLWARLQTHSAMPRYLVCCTSRADGSVAAMLRLICRPTRHIC
jgi:Na+/proline symporter